MKPITQYGILLIAALMLSKSLLMPVVYIDFKLNQDYIAKVLCINRDKPEIHCNGHCVLMKKMQQAQGPENPEQNQTRERHWVEIFCNARAIFDFIRPSSIQEKPSESIEHYFFNHLSKIFHPPKIS